VVILLITTLLNSSNIFCSTSNKEKIKIISEKIEQDKVYLEKKWLRLAHYRKNTFGSYISEADDQNFFLALDGKRNPQAEMLATLDSFFEDIPKRGKDYHSQCHFPARKKFFITRFKLPSDFFPKMECDLLDKFLDTLAAKSVSLVFSSYYLNNPASAFGHTFLKFNKDDKKDNELLDFGISYAANIGDTNPLFYSVGGLIGSFSGVFSNTRYYYKVREYNDFEARDLWSYKLDFSSSEVKELLLHLWELSTTRFDYFFLTENCSYQIFTALEAVRPKLGLLDALPYWIIPSDTVLALNDVDNFVTEVSYRPSIRAKFYRHLAKITEKEKSFFQELVNSNDPLIIKNLTITDLSKRNIYDLYSDYLDYIYPEEVNKDGSLQSQWKFNALAERASLGIKTNTKKYELLEKDFPHKGHSSSRLGLMTGDSQYLGSFVRLQQRFALHDELDLSRGYPKNGKIEFMNIEAEYSEKEKLAINKVDIVAVSSFTPLSVFEKRTSWEMRFGLQRDRFTMCRSCLNGFFEIGFGLTYDLTGDENYLLFGLISSSVEHSSKFDKNNFRISSGPKVGILFNISESLKLKATYQYVFFPLSDESVDYLLNFELRYSLNKEFAIGSTFSQIGNEEKQISLNIYAYY
jgi:hypothetical protein